MALELTILGYNSALPTANSHPSAQLLNIEERYFLIDCGEGTQVQLRRAKAKFSKINHIFISHLHGDHVFGLIGLLSSLQLLGREKELTIHGPKGIREFIEVQMKLSGSYQGYPIIFDELEGTESRVIFEDEKVKVSTIPLDHRIYTNGYLFEEKPKLRRINTDAVSEFPEIDVCDFFNLKKGKDYTLENGKVIPNAYLTFNGPKNFSFAYCSDTRYKPDIVPIIKNVDLLYHESTFLHELKELADFTGHSTALEAAQVAKDANAKRLILGHFSNRYTDYEVLLNEAKTVFVNTELPVSLKKIVLK